MTPEQWVTVALGVFGAVLGLLGVGLGGYITWRVQEKQTASQRRLTLLLDRRARQSAALFAFNSAAQAIIEHGSADISTMGPQIHAAFGHGKLPIEARDVLRHMMANRDRQPSQDFQVAMLTVLTVMRESLEETDRELGLSPLPDTTEAVQLARANIVEASKPGA